MWIVDGYKVRQKIYNSFHYGGNEQRYPFTPKGEIWIDGQISCEETEYSIGIELMERAEMANGKSYSDAYEDAVTESTKLRNKMALRIGEHPPLYLTDTITRDKGIMDKGEK